MNWGTKLVIGLVAFMLFILSMVVYMFKVQDSDSLVEENYYEKGIEYDKEYNAKQNVFSEQLVPEISKQDRALEIKMLANPSEYKLSLLRPSSAKMDKVFEGTTSADNNIISIPKSGLSSGLWQIKLQWKFKGKDYLFVKDIML
jgi:hypothetical protein